MRRTAHLVSDLNAHGIYIRNKHDVTRLQYGIYKSLSKFASVATMGDDALDLSPEEVQKIEEATKKAKANARVKLAKEQAEANKIIDKRLSKLRAFGANVSFSGQAHRGNISVTFTKNFYDLRGQTMDHADFLDVLARAYDDRAPFAKELEHINTEIEQCMEFSKAIFEGTGTLPKQKGMVAKIILFLADLLGVSAVTAGTLLLGAHGLANILGVGGLSAMVALPVVLTGLSMIMGAFFVGWFYQSIRRFGFKGTMNALSSKVRGIRRRASALPSLDYQVGVLHGCL